MKIFVRVTQDDIDNGVGNSEIACPISLAIKSLLPGADVYTNPHGVYTTYWWVGKLRANKTARGGWVVKHFIKRFDTACRLHLDPPKPVAFTLEFE